MTRRERSNPEWQALIAEYQVLKRKLQSKSEALLIISKDLDTARNERDQFKLMAEKLQERCQAFKRQQADFPVTGDKAKLVQMLKDVRNQKVAHQKQSELLQLKLNEALGDVKLLREKFARQTIGDEGIGARHFPLHEREKLVEQLEETQQQCQHWQKEYESQAEVANEALADRDASRDRADRLNQELSYVLSGDKKRIIDIDALCMENKYLQERITQCQAEKNSLHAQINKYKNALSTRKATKGDLHKPGVLRSSGIVVSPKQLKELLTNGVHQNSAEQVADLQSIVSALLETVNDKNLALHHLRNTNKILGNRVADLERKLKTLEVAGLWNMQGSSENTNGETTGARIAHAKQEKSISESALTNGNPEDLTFNDNEVSEQERDKAHEGRDTGEYLSSLGSRLSKLTAEKSSDDCKLISFTPSLSSESSEATPENSKPEPAELAMSDPGSKLTTSNVSNWLEDATCVDFESEKEADEVGSVGSSKEETPESDLNLTGDSLTEQSNANSDNEERYSSDEKDSHPTQDASCQA